MSRTEPQFRTLIGMLQEHFGNERYSFGVTQNYPVAARRFLRVLERRRQSIESVSCDDVEAYLDSLRLRRRRGLIPDHSRRMHGAAIRMLLRLVHGTWPPPAPVPTTAHDIATREIIRDYEKWMTELRGLSGQTRRGACSEASRLLTWIHQQGKRIAEIMVTDLDAYIAWRAASMRRTSIAGLASTVRGILRYLNASGRMPVDLSVEVAGPPLYAQEGIPSTINLKDLERALKATKQDGRAVGHRDYAILMLLSTYGLRAGEVIGLKLTDIDWRHDRLRIHHSKTGAHSELPLLRAPADAILNYLKHGRPKTTVKEVFLTACAPYRPIGDTSTLYGVMVRRFKSVGLILTGKRGAHVLRHSRAVSLLRGGVPLKVIGDVLGHRSEKSTAVYLKLATEDLRSVALDLPAEVSP